LYWGSLLGPKTNRLKIFSEPPRFQLIFRQQISNQPFNFRPIFPSMVSFLKRYENQMAWCSQLSSYLIVMNIQYRKLMYWNRKKIGVLVKKILLKWQERVREYFFLITRKLNSHLSKKSCLDYVCFSKSDLWKITFQIFLYLFTIRKVG
jgi:hypothetical protein